MCKIKAPFDRYQVKSLVQYQEVGDFEKLTCSIDGTVFSVTSEGCECPVCGSTQNWAEDWMVSWAWLNMGIRLNHHEPNGIIPPRQ